MRRLLPLLFLTACWGDDAYILEGTVLEKPSPTRIIVAHEDIPGLMPAMTMPFDVEDPALLQDVDPGERILARLHVGDEGSYLRKIRVTGRGVVPADYEPVGGDALQPGQTLPTMTVALHDGSSWTIGAGQEEATVITFAYTRCPLPDFCPATMARLAGLQEALAGDGRLLVVTLDPDHDTPEVLSAYAESVGAQPGEWMFGRLDGEDLATLARAAGLAYTPEGGEVLHSLRTLVIAPNGTLIERYDDNRYAQDRVVRQVRTGEPGPGSP